MKPRHWLCLPSKKQKQKFSPLSIAMASYFFCTCFENKGCLVGAATSVIYFIAIHCVFFVTVLLEIHHCLEIVAVRLYFSFQFCLMFEMFLRLATEAASFWTICQSSYYRNAARMIDDCTSEGLIFSLLLISSFILSRFLFVFIAMWQVWSLQW